MRLREQSDQVILRYDLQGYLTTTGGFVTRAELQWRGAPVADIPS